MYSSANFPNLNTLDRPSTPSPNDWRHLRQQATSTLATSVLASLERSGKWAQWQMADPRLADFDSLADARDGWRRRDVRCYQVVAGLTALGSRRGGDDDDAALAVVVLLEDGVHRLAANLIDVCEIDDINATVWEEAKSAEPQLGCHAARYLLQRTRQRLCRPAAGMVSRIDTASLEGNRALGNSLGETSHDKWVGLTSDRDPKMIVPEVEDPLEDVVDLLTWARGVGVIATEDIELLVELIAAEHEVLARGEVKRAREEAQRMVGERHGVAMRTIRRRRDRAAAKLRDAAPQYLAAIA